MIRDLGLKAATDVTGFGLGGHVLETARASGVAVRLELAALPLLPRALEYARCGLISAASHANREYCRPWTVMEGGADKGSVISASADREALETLLFDVQSSGGLVLAVPPDKTEQARTLLEAQGELACIIGRALPLRDEKRFLFVE